MAIFESHLSEQFQRARTATVKSAIAVMNNPSAHPLYR